MGIAHRLTMSSFTDIPLNQPSLDQLVQFNQNRNQSRNTIQSINTTPLSSLSQFKHRYESFICSENKWLLPLLDTIKSLTIFLPGRFSEGEIRSEAIYSILNLLQVYHDRILHKQSNAANNEINLIYIGSTNKLYRMLKSLQHILTVLYYTEVLIEMIAARIGSNMQSQYQLLRSHKFKWGVIFVIESIKTYCRLRILYANRGHMLLTRTSDEIVWDTLQRDAEHKKTEFLQQSISDTTKYSTDKLLSYTNTINQPCQSLINLYIEHGRLDHPHGRYIQPITNEIYNTTPNNIKIICELLYWCRPLVYAGGQLLYCDDSNQLWSPWINSLLVDLFAIIPMFSQNDLTLQQRNEVIRRFTLLSYYLLRTPFFESYTQQPLIKLSSILSSVPLFGVVFGNLAELIAVLQKHYFYVSAS